jgi:hypothetical protein
MLGYDEIEVSIVQRKGVKTDVITNVASYLMKKNIITKLIHK